jgi:hypothetical protein
MNQGMIPEIQNLLKAASDFGAIIASRVLPERVRGGRIEQVVHSKREQLLYRH